MDHIVSHPSCRNLIRKIMFVFQLTPPASGTCTSWKWAFFSVCLRASAFEADRESIYELVLGVAERRHLELPPAHGAWSSPQFPQSSQGPFPGAPSLGCGVTSPQGLALCSSWPCLFSWVTGRGPAEWDAVTQLTDCLTSSTQLPPAS